MQLSVTTRRRAFHVGDVENDQNQCLQRGERIMDYIVTLDGDDSNLTPEGFILDGNAIPAYFKRTYGYSVAILPSCEVMARDAARAIAALCQGRAHRVRVDVGGASAIWSAKPTVELVDTTQYDGAIIPDWER